MADILIKGMEMPKTCSQCPMCQDHVMCKLNSFAFWNTNNPFDFRNERLAGCPLIELPEHGDLIDRDKLLEENVDLFIEYDDFEDESGCSTDVIRNAPVIVPSNKEETG